MINSTKKDARLIVGREDSAVWSGRPRTFELLPNGCLVPEGTKWRGFTEEEFTRLAEPLNADPTSHPFRRFMEIRAGGYFLNDDRRSRLGTLGDRKGTALAIAEAAERLRLLLKDNEWLVKDILHLSDPSRWMEDWDRDVFAFVAMLSKWETDARSYIQHLRVRRGRPGKEARREAWFWLVLKYIKETGKRPGRSLGSGARANGPLVRLLKTWSDAVLQNESPGEAVIEEFIESIKDMDFEAEMRGKFL